MPKLTFRGAVIRYMDIRHEEAGLTTRLHMSANYTDRIAEAMEWPSDLPESLDSAKLSGELLLENFILTPNGGAELKRFEIEIPARDAAKFEAVRVSDSDESSHIELRFQVRSGDAKTCALVANYMAKIGKGDGALKVGCLKQEQLDLQDAAEEEEEPEEETAAGPTLASSREVGERSRPKAN